VRNIDGSMELNSDTDVDPDEAPGAPPPAARPADAAAEFQKRVQAVTPGLKESLKNGGADARLLAKRFSESQAAVKAKDFVTANGILDEVESFIETTRAKAEVGMAAWHEAWQDAVDDLHAVIEAVKATNDPDAVNVEIVLNSIVKNLTKDPATPPAVAELRRYLETDDVITAAEEVPGEYGSLDLRDPLLAALTGLAK
jgi:hypothetical protein